MFLARLAESLKFRAGAVLAVRRARAISRRNLAGRKAGRILVVCHGNIYRSPFVAAVLGSSGLPGLQVRSSGFHHVGNRPSPERHVAMSREFGVDLSSHRSSVVTADDLEWADVIVLMDRHNWVRLRKLMADPAKLVWIGAMTDTAVEVADPYNMDDAAARRILVQLDQAARGLLDRLRQTQRPDRV